MGRWIAATVAAFAVMAALAFPAAGQIRGVPTSVTSTGFGGHFDRVPGAPASVTSLGPRGYNDRSHLFVGVVGAVPPGTPGRFGHRPHPGRFFPTPGYYPVYTPVYIVDPSLSYSPDLSNAPMNDSGAAQENQNYSAGPTIFDRRASGDSSQSVEATYSKREVAGPSQPAPLPEPAASHAEAAPEQDQPQTVLIFKDGRQLQVQNYAIVGSTLYDLTPGRHGKIAVSDLDIASTAKENDDRGIDFQLPVQSN
jgi:hypothetical protein